MTCTNFPSAGLVIGVTTHQVGEIIYLWSGVVWEAIAPPLELANDLSVAYEFPTVAAMTASTIVFPVDKALTTSFYNTNIKTNWLVEASANPNKWSLALAGGVFAVLNEAVNDIRHFGGVDDFNGAIGENIKPILDFLIPLRPITIKLPRSEGGTGVYFYDGVPSATSVDYSGLVIDSDDGVELATTGTTNGELWRKGVKYNREIKSHVIGGNYNLYSSPNQYKKPSEQFSKLTHSDGNISKILPLDFTSSDLRSYELSAWPIGTLNPITPDSATAADLDLGTTPAASFKMAGFPVVAGDMVQAHIATGPIRPCLFVETDLGYVIVQQAPGAGSFEVQKYEGGVNTSFNVIDKIFNQDEYRFINASMAILVYNNHSFGVVVNNVVVKRIETTGGIQIAGWGAGFDNANLTINRPSAFHNKKSIGIKQLRIVGVGDSTSADTLPPSQYQYMKQYLAGSCGAQVFELNNIAVGGQTSAQQLTALLATDISSMDYCCIQVGINDVQTSVSPLTYLANVEAMIDYCETENVQAIIGLPTSWYSQTDAQLYGQDGQAVANSTNAPPYRDVLMHGLGLRGDVLMNTSVLEDEGAVLAEWLSIPDADPIVQDNIHPTAYGQMVMGMSYAKAIIGHLNDFSFDNKGVFMPKYWFNSGIGASQSPLMKINNGQVTTEWFYTRDGATINNGDTIATLPERFRPAKSFFVAAINTTANPDILSAIPMGQIQIKDSGDIKAYNVDPAAVFISFNASWSI